MNNSDRITILTDPIPIKEYFFSEWLKIIARKVVYFFRRDEYFRDSYFRGHFAVTKSLILGLRSLEYSFLYNPFRLYKNSNIVIVLAGIQTLKQAIDLKRNGKIKYLFAGPNIVTFSTDCNSIIASKEIDLVIVNSDWIAKLYVKDNVSINNRFIVWPAGVDSNFWCPNAFSIKKQILIYNKIQSDSSELEIYKKFLSSNGFEIKVLNYGSFTKEIYLSELQKSILMIGFPNNSESQGIAWAEAWSCNVPLFVKYNNINTINGITFECSTAPYLNESNGVFFNNFADFVSNFQKWQNNEFDFKPRNWVLENATYEVTSKMLINQIENYVTNKSI